MKTITTVFASQGGIRYHATADCKALLNARDLNDWDCWDDYCRHQHPQPRPIRETTVTDALGAGKWPCATCWPGSTAALAISSSEDDFGHEPGDVITNGKLRAVECFRCRIQWPCTSAVVLGLVEREAAA